MARPLRILIDARMLLGRFSGVARVVTELTEALVRQSGLEVLMLCGSEPYAPWTGRTDLKVLTSSFGRRDRTPARRLWWDEVYLPRVIADAGVDLFHAMWNSGIPARCPVPAVLTIHDLIPWRETAGVQRACYRHAVRAAARRASIVTTVSDHVRRNVIATLPVNHKKVVVVPNGVRTAPSEPRASARAEIPSRESPRGRKSAAQALYVGGHEPRKNLSAVFSAVHRYWRQFDSTLELRLTGTLESLDPSARESYERLEFKNRIHFLGALSEAELSAEYDSASVLLLLSRAEGFGLPVLEAMAHGCPVIAARHSALPEVVGDAGVLVDPDDAEQVAEAMQRILSDPIERENLIQRGRNRASEFRWDLIAARMREIYESAARSRLRPITLHEASWATVARGPVE